MTSVIKSSKNDIQKSNDTEISMTSENTTLNQLTLFAEGSPASPFPLPGSKKARKMTVGSGRKCSALYRNSSPLGYLVKMLLDSSTWGSTIVFLTWKVKVTKSNRLLFQLVPKAPTIEGIESGLWLTPNTMDSLDARSPEKLKELQDRSRPGRTKPPTLREQVKPHLWPTPKASVSGPDYARANREKSGGDDLMTAVVKAKLLPTPTATDARGHTYTRDKGQKDKERLTLPGIAKMLPTPRASDHKGSGPRGSKSQLHMEKRQYLCGVAATEDSGQLNPVWVEWLMGFPLGWSDPDCDEPIACDHEIEPEGLSRVSKVTKNRTNRIKALGNAVYSKIPKELGLAFKEALIQHSKGI